MEFGWSLPKRKQFLKELAAEATDRTHPIRFQTKNQYLPVHVVPIELPLYRLENGRTTGRQAEYLAGHPELPPGFFRVDNESVSAQKAQHEILAKLTRERKNLFKEFETEPQSEPIILTSTGYVVNGNRRLSTWRELFQRNPTKFARFRNIDAIILPFADEKDIDQLEADLQLKEDLKADYSWTSTALMVREKMTRYGYNESELAAIYDKDKKEITEILDCLDYADQYLESRDLAHRYSEVDDKEYAFIQIRRSRKKMKATEAEKETFEKAAFCLADEAGEGKRIYAEIPKIADHLGAVIKSLDSELSLEGKGGDTDLNNRVAAALDDKTKLERARLTIRDAIEAAGQQKKDKSKKEYVSLLILKARDNLRDAKSAVDKQSTREGAAAALVDIANLTTELQAWAADDAE